MIEEFLERNKMGYMEKNTNKILVTINVGEKKIIVKDLNNKKKKIIVPFRGIQRDGRYSAIFKPKNERAILENLYYNISDENSSREEQLAIWGNICDNVNLGIVKALELFDSLEIDREDISYKYAKVMAKNIERQRYEKRSAYKKRQELVRRVELEDTGISINYDFSNMNFFEKGFTDKLRVLRDAIKNRKYAHISLTNKENNYEEELELIDDVAMEPKHVEIQKIGTMSKINAFFRNLKEKIVGNRNKLPEAKQTNIKIVKDLKPKFIPSKSIIENLREKAQQPQFQSNMKRKLANIGAISLMTVGVATLFSSNEPINTMQAPEETKTNNSSFSLKNEIQQDLNNITIPNENNKIQKEETVENNNEVLVDLKETLKDSVDLKFGKDITFNITEGKYWASPDGTGTSGTIKPEDELYITDIDVIDENGFKHYKISDGLSINEIKENHPNGQFSYHVNRIDKNEERICGWINDKETIEKIDSQMTISRLKTLMNYLTPEAKEIFYNIINNDTGTINKSNQEIIQNLINEAQQVENVNQIEEER